MHDVIQVACNALSIADGTATGGRVEELRINGTPVVQDGKFIRALWVTFFDRYNKSNRLDCKIITQHASKIACLKFCAERVENVGGVRDLTITLQEGDSVLTISATAAKWGGTRSGFIGFSSIIEYQIETGQLICEISGDIPAEIDGGSFANPGYGGPLSYTVDGGNLADNLLPTTLDIDAGVFV